jgi:predicted branched-subunit amino acid permease
LAPRVCRLPQRWQIPIAFFLTDETFAVVVKRFQTDAGDESDPGAKWYYLGSAVAMYANWQTCTFLGVTIGQAIPRAAEWGLDFAMPVTFIGMITPYLRSKPMIFAAVMAGTVSLATFTLPNKMGLIVAAAAGILAGVFSERRTLR